MNGIHKQLLGVPSVAILYCWHELLENVTLFFYRLSIFCVDFLELIFLDCLLSFYRLIPVLCESVKSI